MAIVMEQNTSRNGTKYFKKWNKILTEQKLTELENKEK
jgi:hypothetical protein